MLFYQLFLLPAAVFCLQCYTGFKYLAGQSVGTDVETCSAASDYCYNATADVGTFTEIKMAGCSTTRCFLSQNKCIGQTFQGKEIQFCCCNSGDLCNSKFTNMSTFDRAKEKVNDFFGIFGR